MSSPSSAKRDHFAPTRGGHGPRTDRAYEYLRDGILSGDLPVGTVLAEGKIAETLEISRTPVRQALRLLLHEGLVEVVARRQLAVRDFSADHRKEVLLVRESLERIAVRQACEVMTLDDVDQLRLLLIRQRRAADSEDENEFISLDEEFHLSIARAAHFPILFRFLGQLRGFVRLMRLGSVRQKDHLRQVIDEHEDIVDAMEERDEECALAALSHHLRTAGYAPDR